MKRLKHLLLRLSLLLMVFLTGCNQFKSRERQPRDAQEKEPHLSLDDVLRWRNRYADLLDRSKDAVIERYGKPTSEEPVSSGTAVFMYYDSSEKTDGRQLFFFVNSTIHQVVAVKVIAKRADHLDVLEVIKKAPLFDFKTGTGQDSTLNYFLAQTKDGRNGIQFFVSDAYVTFAAATFKQKELSALPPP